jgi:hydroxyacylglutathione hydrolase
MKVLNRQGPPILGELPAPKALSPTELEKLQAEGAQLVDARPKEEFNQGNVPGSINVQADKGFSNWAGWTVDPDRPIVLIAPRDRIDELVRNLIGVGLDRIAGYLPDISSWPESGRELETLAMLDPAELHQQKDSYEIIDVRGQEEWNAGHIPGARHIHVGYLRDRLGELPTDRPLALHCASGARSNLAASILQAEGVKNVTNVSGGIMAWKAAGLPVTTEQEQGAAVSGQ